ncbi:4Fe-4S single cluster domain-containing protein [Pseudobutyrivibrio sp. YE44]|uniref:radical SAM protein n=1 Tax=Pseudobutyrivibrio sp. YE44 TaxID=1520802 RepID=UPI000883EB00|nr:radical SAM protein [Pseudobutyrivibrio sp. YE44]SDB28856.1 4Fe-4S single cluster domain-containing protein [Pseudobutyrivibrio sp. YE44]
MRKSNNFERYESEYIQRKDWVFPYDDIEPGAKIILYGAGDVGQAYYFQIIKSGYCEVVSWIDKDYKKYSEWGLNIESINVFLEKEYDLILLAVANHSVACDINSFLLEQGVKQEKIVWGIGSTSKILYDKETFFMTNPIKEEIKNVLHYKKISSKCLQGMKYVVDILERANKTGIVLPRVVIEATTHCTLKCKYCNNLMPYYQKKRHLDLDSIEKDIEQLFSVVQHILVLEIIGGEPFCYPQLCDLLLFLERIEQYDILEITTNGTIIPNNNVLEALRDKRIIVRISEYNASAKIEGLIKKFKEYGINYEILNDLIWIDSGEPVYKGKSKELCRESYLKCSSARFCKTLMEGRLFCCARAASLFDLGICKDESNYIDIYKDDAIRELRDFYLSDYVEACNYCTNSDEWRIVEAGVQS